MLHHDGIEEPRVGLSETGELDILFQRGALASELANNTKNLGGEVLPSGRNETAESELVSLLVRKGGILIFIGISKDKSVSIAGLWTACGCVEAARWTRSRR